MGRVYKAVQQPLDRVVALKVLNPKYDSSKDPEFEKRFFLEASMTSKLKHPNTITVHDYGRTDDGIFYIAMEFLEGETLYQLLAREKSAALVARRQHHGADRPQPSRSAQDESGASRLWVCLSGLPISIGKMG